MVNRQVCDGENLQNPEYGVRRRAVTGADRSWARLGGDSDVNQAFELTGATATDGNGWTWPGSTSPS